MKKIFFIIITLLIVANSCQQKPSVNEAKTNNEDQISTKLKKNDTSNKFLITNNSVGYFKIGDSWQKYAKEEYNYKFVQGYGICYDACCDGGFDLGNNLKINAYGQAENPDITIGALLFKASEIDDETEQNSYKNNKNIFYISSDNCNGWYWNDKINYIIIYSNKFKTKEKICVGSTLEKVNKLLKKMVINIGWLEEDTNAIQVKSTTYPNISFILDAEDAIGGYEKLSNLGENATISDFKKDSKIKRIIVNFQS